MLFFEVQKKIKINKETVANFDIWNGRYGVVKNEIESSPVNSSRAKWIILIM